MESLKTKFSKMEKYAFDLKQQLENEYPVQVKEIANHETSPGTTSDEEIKKLNEKITTLTNKLAESNNSNLQLKNEIKLAKKIVQQETGDNFENLQSLNNSNGWRGRAQTIIDLQQKNAELKEKLKVAQANNPVEVMPNLPNKSENLLIALTKEHDELKLKYEEIKKKHDVLKARHKVIDIDYTLLKSKSAMLKEQATRDQEIITSLLGQLNTSKEMKNDLVSQKERTITKLQTEKKILLQEIEEYKSVIKQHQDKLKEKENKISEQTINDKVPVCDEKLLEFIQQCNQKLKAEREAHAKTQNLLKIEKQKVVKGEAALARLELEVSTRSTYSSTSTLRALDTSLKDKLELAEEQIKALQTRLEIEQMERKNDLQQFGQILKSYETKNTTSE
ncbi:centrosomal protein of 290 kDa-like [Diorhabda sublineata]|uniref:centrosomal protein of 290 kDa-like n=1 Tax=Diorhabda sublineata TaxID=1163346 RepID=UPI0024E0D261|nr:centrosomal protein of 290 kDa-like [Diorhabda sublineata]